MQSEIKNNRGFSLIELMVSLVISSFVVAGIYGVYTIQQRSYKVQEQVSEMQQRLRAAVQFMASEIRMAGYDPPNDYPDPNPYDPAEVCDDAKIETMNRDELVFEFCKVTAGDQDPPVYTAELMKTAYSLYDAYDDGVSDLGVQHGDSASTKRALAEGIEAIEFLYLDDTGKTEVTDTADIRQIRISILARSTFPDPKYTDTTVYEPASVREGFPDASSWGSYNDHYHRRLLITTVKLRNMGLE